MTSPDVTVLMGVHNGERHLAKSIESVLKQTFSSFEFLIVDDGSNDTSPSILRDFAMRDNRIRLVRNKTNLGLTKSLNVGLNVARGRYVARQDDDDYSMPDRLSRQVHYLEKNPAVGLLGTAYKRINQHGLVLGETKVPVDHEVLKAMMLMANPLCHGSIVARTDVLLDVGGYDSSYRYAQDYDMWWKVSKVAYLAALPEPLVARRYGHNISATRSIEQSECALDISARIVSDVAEEEPLDKEAFTRLWWTQKGDWRRLQPGDAARVGPLWNAIGRMPAGPEVWGPTLRAVSKRMILMGRIGVGFQLLWTTVRMLGLRNCWRSSSRFEPTFSRSSQS